MVDIEPHVLSTIPYQPYKCLFHWRPYWPLGSIACTTFAVSPKPKNERPVPQSDSYAVVAYCPGWDPVWQALGPVLSSLGRAVDSGGL